MQRHLQCAEQQVSPSNPSKYSACQAGRLACLLLVTYEMSFTMRGATGVTIQYCACHEKWHCKISEKMSENRWNVIYNAGTIRAWSDHDPSMKPSVRTPPRNWGYFSRSPRAFCIENYNISRRLSFKKSPSVPLARKVTLQPHAPNTTPATKSDAWTSPSAAPPTKRDAWTSPTAVPATKSDDWTSPSAAPATKRDTWTSRSAAPATKSEDWTSPKVVHLPRKVTLELHQLYCTCHEKRTWASSTLFFFTLTLLYFTLLHSILLYPTLLYFTLLHSILLYFTLLCFTLLYSTLLYSTLLYPTLLYSTLLYPTLLYSTLLCSTLV